MGDVYLLEHGKPVLFNTPRAIICCQSFGAPDGRPLFHFHGQVSSRLEARFFERAAAEHGIRIIGMDRPGFGKSPPAAVQVRDWPAIIASLADQMGFAQFGLQGVSAGVKYALATVLEVPERVTGVSLVSSFGPADDPALQQAAARIRLSLALYRRTPALGSTVTTTTAFLLRHAARGFLRATSVFIPKSEREMLAASDAFDTTADVLRAAACQGPMGIDEEFRLLLAPWNLPLGEIRRPVTI